MAMNNPYNQYKENSIKTASPEELVLMLYNGAIKFMNQGKLYMDQKNVPKTHEVLTRAQNIIKELNVSLDMQYEISQNLRSLYVYILEKLLEGNMSKKQEPIDEAISIVAELRDTWKEAMKLSKIGHR